MRLARLSLPIFSILALLAAIGSASTLAQKAHIGHGHGHGQGHDATSAHAAVGLDRIIDHLGVDESQREQLHAIHAEYEQVTTRVNGDVDLAHEALAAAIHGEIFDEAAIRAAAAEYSILQADLYVAKAEMFRDVRQLLSPDQLEKLRQTHDVLGAHGGEKGLSGHPLHHK